MQIRIRKRNRLMMST